MTRINELADQAGIGRLVHVGSGEWAWYSPEAQIFAQLIIEECGNFTDPITRALMYKHFGLDLDSESDE